MATVTPIIPSGSTDGAPVKVVPTATPGTLFHTASAVALTIDEAYLWACNTSAADVVLTVELGDATAPDHNVKVTVPANDAILVLAGIRIQNSKTIRAFAAVANVVNLFGNINRFA